MLSIALHINKRGTDRSKVIWDQNLTTPGVTENRHWYKISSVFVYWITANKVHTYSPVIDSMFLGTMVFGYRSITLCKTKLQKRQWTLQMLAAIAILWKTCVTLNTCIILSDNLRYQPKTVSYMGRHTFHVYIIINCTDTVLWVSHSGSWRHR